MTVDMAAAKITLLEERAKLVHQMDELGANEHGDLRPDLDFGEGFADAAAITAERTELIGLANVLKDQLSAIDEALGRIEDGSYGTCSNCGKDIGAARLEIRPMSNMCIECKSASR